MPAATIVNYSGRLCKDTWSPGGHACPVSNRWPVLLSWARQAGFTAVTATSSTWCYASPGDRAWWGGMWADRIVHSALARQLLASQLAAKADLDRISQGWRTWAAADDGWFSVLHGEILCQA